MSDVNRELEQLIEQLLQGELSDVEQSRLAELLQEPSCRQRYLDFMDVHAGMLDFADSFADAAELESLVNDRVVSPLATERRPQLSRWLVLAATVAFCLIAGRWSYLEFRRDGSRSAISQSRRGEASENTSRGVAIITRLVDVSRPSRQPALSVGDAVEPGLLEITSGFAQLEFFCGATVVLEGPVQLDLQSPMAARLVSGQLRARVPPAARGFTIDVPEMKVVDLGTEFGLRVSQGVADVQVFDGEVELQLDNDTSQRLVTGDAVTHDSSVVQQASLAPEDFTSLVDLQSRFEEQDEARFAAWQAYSAELKQDPRLVLYYTFDDFDSWQRTIHNQAQASSHELDGAIVGARRVPGRWNEKTALDFKQPGDRIRVQVPGEYGSLTFACWVKIDSLDRWYNSLFLTDNYQQGEPHWQILDTGQLFFSVRVSDQEGGQEHAEVISKPFWNPSLSGKWLHLATTYDVEKKRTTHFLNGQVLSSETISDEQLVPVTRFGTGSIANWSVPTKPDTHFAVRNLNGSMDEFAIFADALSATEIAEMYQHGKP